MSKERPEIAGGDGDLSWSRSSPAAARDEPRAREHSTLGAKGWSTRKRDQAPRGVFRHRSGAWAIRFACGAGHIHEEKVGPIKGDAVRVHAARRQRTYSEPGWCPAVERREARAEAHVAAERERRRVTFQQYAEDYLVWSVAHHRSHKTTRAEVTWLSGVLAMAPLPTITTADLERVLAGLQTGSSPSGRALSGAAVNRYRDRLSGMFKRALRLGLVERNPVTGIPKHKEPGGRITYLTEEDERAVREALPPALRPLFTVAIHTGLRWSEQQRVVWADVDMVAGTLTVTQSKNGRARVAPMNSLVRQVLLDLASRRARPEDPRESVFRCPYRDSSKFFPQAVERAKQARKQTGMDTSRLAEVTWHSCRHTFASRLVMGGVDLRTVMELGGWRSFAMVQRYSHLSPDHLRAAVERIVPPGHSELGRNLDSLG